MKFLWIQLRGGSRIKSLKKKLLIGWRPEVKFTILVTTEC